MTSKNVTNNHTSPLGLSAGQTINPGATVRVDNWESVENSHGVKTWVDMGLLSVADARGKPAELPQPEAGSNVLTPPATPPAAATGLPGVETPATPPAAPGLPGVDENAEKQKIIKELAKYNIKRTTKTPLESLQRQLAEAKGK